MSDPLSLEPSFSFNWVDLPQGSFRNDLALTRVNYAFTPRMFFGGLVQYNSGSDSFSTNLRLRWEYRPGSELFVVYTEARDTDVFAGPSSRTVASRSSSTTCCGCKQSRSGRLADNIFMLKVNYWFNP